MYLPQTKIAKILKREANSIKGFVFAVEEKN